MPVAGAIAGAIASAVATKALNRGAENDARRASRASADANAAAAEAARLQAGIAKDQWDRYKTVYGPREEQFVDESFNYDTPERRQQAMDEAGSTAGADAAAVFGRDQEAVRRGLDRFGSVVNPNALAAQMAQTGLGTAAARAGAMTTARRLARDRIENLGRAYKTDAISLGKGLAATAGNLAGNSASANTMIAQNGLNMANAARYQSNQNASLAGGVMNRIFSLPAVQQGISNFFGGGSGGAGFGAGGTDQWTGGSPFAWD